MDELAGIATTFTPCHKGFRFLVQYHNSNPAALVPEVLVRYTVQECVNAVATSTMCGVLVATLHVSTIQYTEDPLGGIMCDFGERVSREVFRCHSQFLSS